MLFATISLGLSAGFIIWAAVLAYRIDRDEREFWNGYTARRRYTDTRR